MAERKRYIDVLIPSLHSSFRVLGTLENLPGKTIRLDLSRKMRGKGLVATFRIFARDDSLVAIPSKLELSKMYIRKMMRKRVDYVEDSFVSKCADVSSQVKPFLITRKRVSRAVRKNLRGTAREFITEYVKDKNFTQVCDDIFHGVLQKAMLPKLKKVYPLSFCEIRVVETKEIDKVDLEKACEMKAGEEQEAIVEEVEESKDGVESDDAQEAVDEVKEVVEDND